MVGSEIIINSQKLPRAFYGVLLKLYCAIFIQREEAALRALEEQHAREEKKRSQEQTRAELNLSLRLKMKRKARETQEELAMDMKLLEEMLKKSSDEATEHYERKVKQRQKKIHVICLYSTARIKQRNATIPQLFGQTKERRGKERKRIG